MNRATSTRERLIDAAAEILEKQGLKHLNTNALAETAGVTPPTVYRNFNNKEEVVECLARRFIAAERDWLSGAESTFSAAPTPAEAASTIIDLYWESARRQQGIVALRSAMRVWPALKEVEEQSLENSASTVARVLAAQLPDIAHSRLLRIARHTVELVCSTVDRCYPLSVEEQSWRIKELKQTVAAYLENQTAKQ